MWRRLLQPLTGDTATDSSRGMSVEMLRRGDEEEAEAGLSFGKEVGLVAVTSFLIHTIQGQIGDAACVPPLASRRLTAASQPRALTGRGRD
ncbi:hypothetical protein E2C01_082122 [Portunus trituberculatus]|uniref:Uncharacterized protein n=1 Tax=Portunus trituberculatus TaxID=210409 RepID=A0A5B7IXM1_PORTR|nr:hypothetical protein [Portunus trituberculatus]